jgi:RNA 3'-terminal phosphate cyclase (ATP)
MILQDQIIIFMALAEGQSIVRTGPLTLHTKTAIWVAEHLTDAKFEINEDPSGAVAITCQGIGFKAISNLSVDPI